jgi:hypothetical protein
MDVAFGEAFDPNPYYRTDYPSNVAAEEFPTLDPSSRPYNKP